MNDDSTLSTLPFLLCLSKNANRSAPPSPPLPQPKEHFFKRIHLLLSALSPQRPVIQLRAAVFSLHRLTSSSTPTPKPPHLECGLFIVDYCEWAHCSAALLSATGRFKSLARFIFQNLWFIFLLKNFYVLWFFMVWFPSSTSLCSSLPLTRKGVKTVFVKLRAAASIASKWKHMAQQRLRLSSHLASISVADGRPLLCHPPTVRLGTMIVYLFQREDPLPRSLAERFDPIQRVRSICLCMASKLDLLGGHTLTSSLSSLADHRHFYDDHFT